LAFFYYKAVSNLIEKPDELGNAGFLGECLLVGVF
jgi:hypothetical protein